MWTPRVLRPLLQPRLGGGAASFARAVLARHGPVSDSQRYPDAWLVFREAEERAAAQTVSETRLTQLTLRLALQLNEYYAAAPGREPPPAMEGAALRETLRVCLTALERRDRETCREVRLLTGLSAPAGAAQAPVPAEVYTVETERGSRTYDIYRENIPLTLEDLGYTVTEADHCSYQRGEQASPLVRWVQYSQSVHGEDSDLPELVYDTADIPWAWLRELCWGRLARYFDFAETDPGPWGADRAIMDEGATGYRRYLLLYGERIVFLFLEEVPTAEQRTVIAAALRS